jgi:predicted nucleic acid-binding protein
VKLVVDTNIGFSAIISDKGKIGELLLNKPVSLHYLSPVFLLEELNKHIKKILLLTKYSEAEYQQIKSLIIKHIDFVDTKKISKKNWETSYQLLKDIDEKDTSFIALNLEINGLLWTGDKKLIKGLENKNYTKIVTTDILYTKYFEF